MRRASVTGADCEYPGCHRAATHLLWHNEQYRCDYHGMDWRRPADWMDVRDAESPITPSPPPQPALDRIAADADESERRGVEWRERALRAEARVRALEETVGELLETYDRDLAPRPIDWTEFDAWLDER